ncbi:MAG: ATP synthase F1 subunit gamma [Clostridiales bacterium]|jgi:F-type H+-transporting ATPase subunit gamma|nr:ATP synthase F1 subunit gamma [Clostridiales bacterium]
MQNTNEIKYHMSAVAETRKITSAMNLISSARLQKVMKHIYYNNEYLSRVQSSMKHMLSSPRPVDHSYLKTGVGKRRLYIVVAGDKGMVGSYNSDVLNFALKEIEPFDDIMLATIGLVAGDFFRSKGIKPDIEIPGLSQNPTLYNARELMREIVDLYSTDEVRSVYFIYTTFTMESASKPVIDRFLPLRIHDYEDIKLSEPNREILYVPSATEVFEKLVPQYLVGIIFGALVQSHASEHFARMSAMQSATDNADELLKKLKLKYNTARQSAITQEIAEISGSLAADREVWI